METTGHSGRPGPRRNFRLPLMPVDTHPTAPFLELIPEPCEDRAFFIRVKKRADIQDKSTAYTCRVGINGPSYMSGNGKICF